MPYTIIAAPAPEGDDEFDPNSYVASVQQCMAVVRASRVGQAVLRHLWKQLEIRPWRNTRQNASARPLQRADARPAGQPDRYDSDSFHTAHDDTGHAIEWMPRGTGRGSDVLVRFTPALYLSPSAPIPAGRLVPRYADSTLLHELVHAVRMMWGVMNTLRFETGRDDRVWGFHNSEEFYAILIENMYRSERGLPMRADHLSDRRLSFQCHRRGSDDPYVQLERRWIAKLALEMPTLVSELERIPRILVRRNPFADARYDQYSEVPVRARRRPPRAGYHYGFLFDPRAR